MITDLVFAVQRLDRLDGELRRQLGSMTSRSGPLAVWLRQCRAGYHSPPMAVPTMAVIAYSRAGYGYVAADGVVSLAPIPQIAGWAAANRNGYRNEFGVGIFVPPWCRGEGIEEALQEKVIEVGRVAWPRCRPALLGSRRPGGTP